MGRKKLLDCAEIFSGFSYRTLPAEENSGSITLVQPKDIDQDTSRFEYNNALKINEFSGDGKHFLCSGDILISSKGKTTPSVLFRETERRVIGSSAFIIVRPVLKIVAPDYLAWYFQLPVTQKYFQASKAGVTVLNLSLKAVQELEVILPGRPVQEKIGQLHCSLLEQNAKQLELIAKERKLLNHLMYDQIKK